MTKTVLIASSNNSPHLISELPYLLKKGGYDVTVIGSSHWTLTHSSYIDSFIEAEEDPQAVIEEIGNIVRKKSFDLIIMGTDRLIWSLLDSSLNPSIKAKLFPIRNLDYLYALEGKIGVAQLCEQLHILAPTFRVVKSKEEACLAAKELGFPLMLKLSRSGGGDGVYKYDSIQELENKEISFDTPFLMQKYIDGDLISVEPFFHHSELIAYAYSTLDVTTKPFQPSIQRTFFPCPEVEPILQTLGRNLQIEGFANISFIRERKSQKHYFIELDFRPNRWVRYSTFAGVDWSKAMRNPSSGSIEKPKIQKHLRHFPEDFFHAIRTKNFSHLSYWLFNRNNGWKVLPFYDLPLMRHGLWRMLKKMGKYFLFVFKPEKANNSSEKIRRKGENE